MSNSAVCNNEGEEKTDNRRRRLPTDSDNDEVMVDEGMNEVVDDEEIVDEDDDVGSVISDEDVEYEEDDEETNEQPRFVFGRNRNPDPELANTVTLFNCPETDELTSEMDSRPELVLLRDRLQEAKVYVVGTAHFSKESQEDVKAAIAATQPDVVMVELCSSRVNVLSYDEETLLEEAKTMNTEKIMAHIRKAGVVQGVIHVLLVSMSAHITKQLGMAPGGEFRAAFQAVQTVPGCRIVLGDRPIQITLSRAIGALNWWQKLKLLWSIIISHRQSISQEDVERVKQSDLLEEFLRELGAEFPQLSEILIAERDKYMSRYLLDLARVTTLQKSETLTENDTWEPAVVVAVVGIGHVPGFVNNWNKDVDIDSLMSVPEKSKFGLYLRHALKGTVLGVGGYMMYRTLYWLYTYVR